MASFIEILSQSPRIEHVSDFRIDEIERQRIQSLLFYNRSAFPSLLRALEIGANGTIIQGREGLADLEELIHWPLYEESVVMTFLLGRDDVRRKEYIDSAVGIETTPQGIIYVHGGGMFMDKRFPFGSSILLPSEWDGNRQIQVSALQKALLSPRILSQDVYEPKT